MDLYSNTFISELHIKLCPQSALLTGQSGVVCTTDGRPKDNEFEITINKIISLY